MTKPNTGDLWEYPYLWVHQDERGETEGRKPRPVVFTAVVKASPTKTYLYILPITGTEPDTARDYLEVPPMEVRRAGLDSNKKLWIIFDEHNRDTLETSFYFNSNSKRQGSFSKAFIKVIAKRFMGAFSSKQSKLVNRQ
ncbi:hypothetical protein A9Q96_09550 [Rhodobacterales bacterium 52_120_T64]|nr:hypothetical protein A9Q96_09550 [Rhodobacterales bacterium 52_120_T64]